MKKKKKWLSLCALIGMLSVVLSLSASADYYYTLDRGVLTDVQQAKSNWCWAACAEMAGHYVYPQTDKSQWAVVRYFKGTATEDYPNVGGDSSDMERAVEYVANNTVDYSVVTAALRCSQIYNEVVVDRKPIIAAMQGSGLPQERGMLYWCMGFDMPVASIMCTIATRGRERPIWRSTANLSTAPTLIYTVSNGLSRYMNDK